MPDGSFSAAERVTPRKIGRTAAACVVLLGPFLGLCRVFWPFTVDDTFITLRYARHLAIGQGLTWNPGSVPPAEGYTSFLWTVLLAPAHWWTSDAVTFAKALGFFATLLTMGLAVALAGEATWGRAPRERRMAMLVTGLVLSIDVSTAVHAVSGMDTALFTLSSTAAMLCAARTVRQPSPANFRRMTMLALVVGLTRPEGNLALAVMFAVVGLTLRRDQAWRLLRTFVLGFVVPASVYFAWRMEHYGLLFPLPFYVKAVEQARALAGLDEAWAFVWEFAISRPLLGTTLALGIWRAPRTLRPALVAAAALFLFFLKPAPLMAYNHRYLHPIVPLLCACVGAGAVHLSTTLASLGRRWGRRTATEGRRGADRHRKLAIALALLVAAEATIATLRALPGHLDEKLSYARGLRAAHERLATTLAASPFTGRIALLDVGAVAYSSGWNVLDTFGLNEPHIARHGRGDAGYVLRHSPDLIVVVSSRANRYVPVFPYEEELFAASVSAGYRAVQSLEFVADYHLRVLAKPESPAAALFSEASPSRLAVESPRADL